MLSKIRENTKIISIFVAIALLIYVFKFIGYHEMIDALYMINRNYFILALILYSVTLVLHAYRWSSSIGITGHFVSIRKALHFQLIDKVANSIFPTSAVGMAIRATLLKKDCDIPQTKGLATIVLDYGFDIFGTFLLAIPCMLILDSKLPNNVSNELQICIFLLGVATISVVLLNTRFFSKIFSSGGAESKNSFIGKFFSQNKYGTKAMAFIKTFGMIKSNTNFAYTALLITFGIRLTEAVRMMVLFKAFGFPMPFYYFLLFESAWLFLSPFMVTPGGIGAVESGKIFVYSMIPNFTAPQVAPIVIVDRFITFWLMIALGSVAVLLYNKSSSDVPFKLPDFFRIRSIEGESF